ncbi:uncharacterized protein LOC141904344 [Tubulanus polymorphus]|uniref:uncharacterized protein LOC141904344 n=1 Tax=Tubulanus polymorphus TaxID=672921 RepID=UPI003DA43493
MPNNRLMAMKRLMSTEKSLQRNPERAAAYDKTFKDYVDRGFARKLSPEEAAKPNTKRWFLPHHAVVNPNKKKLRVVFDAGATCEGKSLNSKLLTGPDLLQSLPGILLRFRENPVAMMADVEKMYHQVRVAVDDQPALSFLWRDMNVDQSPDVYQMMVTIFGAKCSPAMANYALRKAAEDHCQEDDPVSVAAAQAVKSNFYMDDFLKSEEDVASGSQMQSAVTEMVKKGGFRLTEWQSNSRELLASVPDSEVAVKSLSPDECLPTDRALGVLWDCEKDTLGVKVQVTDVPATKRGLLSKASSLFDPFGIAAPFTLVAKILVQRLWSEKIDWDAELTGPELVAWQGWMEQLQNVTQLRIPRCLQTIIPVTRELHVFCDASEKAFGAVAYLRLVSESGEVRLSFVMSKVRVSHLKKMSIVRMETQAAVLAVRLAKNLKTELTFAADDTVYWSDSLIVLGYITNESRRFHVFIANRIAEIRDESKPDQWHHIPGCMNPADVCSRGSSASELVANDEWLNGPSFLLSQPEDWPQREEEFPKLQDEDPEVRRQMYHINVVGTEVLPDPARFSSWVRYKRVVSWICRYQKNLKKLTQKMSPLKSSLTAEELKEAKLLILQDVQANLFPAEIEALKQKKSIPRRSHILQLTPVITDDGLLRARGRLENAPIPYSAKHPILLPTKHEVTRLVLMNKHYLLFHAGVEHTLNEVRQTYWVPKGRSRLRKLVFDCKLCKKRRVKPEPPLMSDLPAVRFERSYPFYNTGIDYFGPFTVRRFRKTEKRYGVLMTCLTTRAVHLELAEKLDTDSFLLSLRRFMARRGHPAKIHSDNGTNLKGGERELRESIAEWNQQKISDELTQLGIEWYFQPPGLSKFAFTTFQIGTIVRVDFCRMTTSSHESSQRQQKTWTVQPFIICTRWQPSKHS